ncbi:PspA/IM30 family protein [Fodinisporobacter ferrooxydans]|uniref:PspA/IM30 family protein n=1 Tax=Fodinisporobacter ferrooxydans TaxID=2901836 RepID=A0ABY4CNU6_9BACL|nr:PspA/IM30 family protein [Alicyclobacillaceae bacterium MYW30-H2]
MSIFGRIKDIVRANINEIISKAEDPEKALNLYIEDAIEQLRQFKVEVSRFEAERIRIAKEIRTCESMISDWHEKAKLAIREEKEDLARKALEKEQHEQDRLEKLQPQLEQAEKTSAQLKEQLQSLEEKLEEAREKRDDLISRNRLAETQKSLANAVSGLSGDDPLSKFDRMEEKVKAKEAEAEAANVTLQSSLRYEFDELEKQEKKSKVDDALTKLRAELHSESK